MRYELISDEEYDSLPEDKEQYFAAFESICRRNMTNFISQDTSQDFDRMVHAQYMAAVSAVAEECDIPNLSVGQIGRGNIDEEYNAFLLSVQKEVAKIRVRERRSRQHSVHLSEKNRAIIRIQVDRLRTAIDQSDLTPDDKQKLYRHLRDFEDELNKARLSFSKAMLTLSVVLAAIGGVGGMTTIAADGPNAIANIIQLIGIDKESEDAAALRLSAPLKALPAPEPKPAAKRPPAPPQDLDDDIPF
jgi:hypothetical protein